METILGIKFYQAEFDEGRELYQYGAIDKLSWEGDRFFCSGYFYGDSNPTEVTGQLTDDVINDLFCEVHGEYSPNDGGCPAMAATLLKVSEEVSALKASQAKNKNINEMSSEKIKIGEFLPEESYFRAKAASNYLPAVNDLLQLEYQEADLKAGFFRYRDALPNIMYRLNPLDDRKRNFIFDTIVYFPKDKIDVQYTYINGHGYFTLDKETHKSEVVEVAALLSLLTIAVEKAYENKAVKTNQAAKALLNRYRPLMAEPNQPAKVRPYLQTNSYGELTLIFKAGVDNHMYKLQSPESVLDKIKRGDPIRLGKFFDQPIRYAELDTESRYWIDFLRYYDDLATQLRSDDDYYYSTRNKLQFPVVGSIADLVNDALANDHQIYGDAKLVQRVRYQSNDQALNWQLDVDKLESEAQLTLRQTVTFPDDVIEGKQHLYHFDGKTWVNYEQVSPQAIEQSGLALNQQYIFEQSDINDFAHKILPDLQQRLGSTVHGQVQLEPYILPDAKFEFKLDVTNDLINLLANVNYGEKTYNLLAEAATSQRDESQETPVAKKLSHYFSLDEHRNLVLPLSKHELVDDFINNGLNQLQAMGDVQATAAFRRLIGQLEMPPKVSIGLSLADGMLDLTVGSEQLSPADVEMILNAYHEHKKYVRLKNGDYRSVQNEAVSELATVIDHLAVAPKTIATGEVKLPAFKALELANQLGQATTIDYQSDDEFKQLIADFDGEQIRDYQIPTMIKATLRPYQITGYQWLRLMAEYHFGGLLADEMGLGKTLQIITYLAATQPPASLPSLIVVPASVVYNWEAEINHFAPNLKVATLGGTKAQRRQLLTKANEFDVLITSYDSLKRDLDLYLNLSFTTVVLDEAQIIKNAGTVGARAVKQLQATQRFALTGTPIENRLTELWSIFDFLMPGLLGTVQQFENRFVEPWILNGNAGVQQQLSQLIAPFTLRRLKADVLKDLPAKTNLVEYAEMSGNQAKLYQARAERLRQQIEATDDDELKGNKIEVLAELTRLRQLCNDPHLVYDDFRGKSAKLLRTMELVQNQIANGHKILLFSQFTSMLKIIETELDKKSIPAYVITGSTDKQTRQRLVTEFNQLTYPAVFLISLKAGGTGLNLTSADVVIHYDPWWNAAAQNQASDRAHRIGQENPVTIYQMITKGTIEEQIKAIQDQKQSLAQQVLAGKGVDTITFNKDELLAILGSQN